MINSRALIICPSLLNLLNILESRFSITTTKRSKRHRVKKVLEKDWKNLPENFDEVFEIDTQARNYAKELI